MRDKKKEAEPKKQEVDIMEEIQRLNEVTQKYSRLNMEISEMEESLPSRGESGMDGNQQYELAEEVRGIKEKLKLVKGDVSMADIEVKGLLERLKKMRKKQKDSGWKVVAVFELVGLIALGAAFLVYAEVNRNRTVPSVADPSEDPEEKPTQEPNQPETDFFVDDLKERVAR